MNSNNTNALDKSLPALPPTAVPKNAFTPAQDLETPPSEFYTDTPSELSPRPHRSSRRNDGSTGPPMNRSSSTDDVHNGKWPEIRPSQQIQPIYGYELTSNVDNVTLPASTYGDISRSYASSGDPSNGAPGDDGFFIPLALDPNPAPGPSPMTSSHQFDGSRNHSQKPSMETDYLNKGGRLPSAASNRDLLGENSSRSSSMDRARRDASWNRPPASPHIAYQQKGRQPSDYIESRSRRDRSMDSSPVVETRNLLSQSSSAYNSQAVSPSDFKLQEAPRARNGSISKKLSKSNPATRNVSDGQKGATDSMGSDVVTSPASIQPSPLPEPEQRTFERPTRGDSLDRPKRGDSLDRPARGDSLGPQHRQRIPRKELPDDSDSTATSTLAGQTADRNGTNLALRSQDSDGSLAQVNGGRLGSRPSEQDAGRDPLDVPNLPARSTSRPNHVTAGGDNFTAPRVPPAPPAGQRHRPSESISTIQSNVSAQLSPALPRYSSGGDFTMEEEMGRIWNRDQPEEKEHGVLRKVSNAAKHMRSFSDRGANANAKMRDGQFGRSPSITHGSVDLGTLHSPTGATPEKPGDNAQLKHQLRRMQKRNAELEAERSHLIDMVNSRQDVKAVNEDLKQKRSTMAFLDTQREVVVRELEVMTEHLKKAKESNQPLDVNQLKSDIMRDFGSSLNALKHELAGEIEDLIHKRNEITNEIADLIQMKDRGNQEYEELAHKNQQLNSMNNEMMGQSHNNKGKPTRPPLGPNGMGLGSSFAESGGLSSGLTSPDSLGIYQPQSSHGSAGFGLDPSRTNSADPSMATLVNEDAEPAVMTAPHVVNIRKGRPNMWKKGSQAVAKNIRGIKGAFAGDRQFPDRPGYEGQGLTEGVPYGSMQEGTRPSHNAINISGPMNVRRADPTAQYNMLAQGQAKKLSKPGAVGMGMPNGSSTNVGENGLFGSDLTARCQFEKREIPSIVTSCIQEVEIRGMDVEGIYRKSGGSGQVNAVRVGFEKDSNYDVSDPDLDIHAVTSCLKQYFRRLPVPLITYDVYDELLEAAKIPSHDEKMHEMRACVDMLPKANRDVLSFLMFHLARVMAKEGENLVSHSLMWPALTIS